MTSGDAYAFTPSWWQTEYLQHNKASAWRIPGRIGIIAGSKGISFNRFYGYHYLISEDNCFPENQAPDGRCYKRASSSYYTQQYWWLDWSFQRIFHVINP